MENRIAPFWELENIQTYLISLGHISPTNLDFLSTLSAKCIIEQTPVALKKVESQHKLAYFPNGIINRIKNSPYGNY